MAKAREGGSSCFIREGKFEGSEGTGWQPWWGEEKITALSQQICLVTLPEWCCMNISNLLDSLVFCNKIVKNQSFRIRRQRIEPFFK